MTRLLVLAALLAPAAGFAAPWTFGEPVTLEDGTDGPWYQHLDGAGRQHVAVSGAAVAIVWESDRSGAPQVYLALRAAPQAPFVQRRISGGDEAFEPVVVAAPDGRFVAAWEQDGTVQARAVGAGAMGPVVRLGKGEGRQVALASRADGRLAAVWVVAQGGKRLLHAADLTLAGDTLEVGPARPVAPVAEHAFQAFPSARFAAGGALVVAWEDRRAGHTRLFVARREAGRVAFAAEQQLNEHNSPTGPGGEPVRLGSGVMRVVLAGTGDRLQAVWLDKRDPGAGYAVWGAGSRDGGRSFGTNQRVQDDGGATVAQWHATVAAGAGETVAAWDDAREGWGGEDEPGDVILSWREGEAWSADRVVPGASGPGYQGSPALAVGPSGDLHLAWIERLEPGGPTRLRYLDAARAR